jgi:hypothetical protein
LLPRSAAQFFRECLELGDYLRFLLLPRCHQKGLQFDVDRLQVRDNAFVNLFITQAQENRSHVAQRFHTRNPSPRGRWDGCETNLEQKNFTQNPPSSR